MRLTSSQSGFTLTELMVSLALLSIILTSGSILFTSGGDIWSVTQTNTHMQENLRRIFTRISSELQESGKDENGNLKVTIYNNTGINGTDILRFSVPICPCGTSPINSNGDVAYWGAPMTWGESGCTDNYPVENNNKVKICHLPPGNPNNEVSIQVSVNAVKAHLAHGDRIGECNACSVVTYPNHYIQYSINAAGQMLRQILDSNAAVQKTDIVGDNVSDFQAQFDSGQTVVVIDLELERVSNKNRTHTMSDRNTSILRNGV